MPVGNKIALSSFAFEDFKLPVLVINLSSAEDVFPSIARLPAGRTHNTFQTRARLVLEEYRLFFYGQN